MIDGYYSGAAPYRQNQLYIESALGGVTDESYRGGFIATNTLFHVTNAQFIFVNLKT